ncbi:Mg/Co/Ni transporter MgtE [Fulvivirga imtechensis AK7]|uniref:Magnesium transporter MgtE n=1 Tax=Fulvivirga imtechensis AK7 TaxID=1237149 RepID=L8JJ05_9BACT|nr:magnesium transporter [Fulvivirga imtechensis]ELR68223.1 Mg/Co/Ni transporter MgtE [Fulvivirga imtechensis AK7]
MEEIVQFELSNEFRERFQRAVDEKDESFIKESLQGVNPADISTLLHEFDTEDSKYVIDLLPLETRAEIINDLDEDIREKFLKVFEPNELTEIVNHLDSDDAVDILNELPIKEREEVIANLDNEEKEANILDLLRYDEDVAGGLMAKELIKANVNWTVVQCIEEIRRQAENVQKVYSVYVVDDNDRLLGRVSLKRIILADDKKKIADIYEPGLVSVETYMSEEEVAQVMRKYDLEAVPVVNMQGKLLGRITIDDVVDVITELADEERQIMSGISGDVEEADSVWMLSRARLPWLIIGIIGGLINARLIGVFEDDLLRITAIAFFIPLIQATGGNVGIQSSSIVVQSLANPSVFNDSMVKRLVKVFLVAALNGIMLSLLVYGVNMITGGSQDLSFVVSIALFSVVLIASFMGTITPLVLDKFGFNPALASGPFITTTNDLLGLAIYFYTVHLML